MKTLKELVAPTTKGQFLSKWLRESELENKNILTWGDVCKLYGIELSFTDNAKAVLASHIQAEQGGTQVQAKPFNADLAFQIAQAVSPFMPKHEDGIDEVAIIELIKKHSPVNRIEISVNGSERKDVGVQHKQFEQILIAISTGIPLMLVGEAGGGKTTCVENVAKALSKEFYCMSVGSQTTKSDLMGYMDANGVYRNSIFRTAFEKGGVFLLDEVDAGNANVITCLNAALANGVCSFPDGMIVKHPDFVCIASANTFGTGASRSYVGRNQLDAASLDRFAVIEFKYDEDLERVLSGNDEWVSTVQSIRKQLRGERVIISPRASIYGAKLLLAGVSKSDVMEMLILKGCNADIRSKIVNA